MPADVDPARPVRRAPTRPPGRRARARLRTTRALRGEGRVQAARADDRALRRGRPPRRTRATEEEARRGRLVRRSAEAPAAVSPRQDRARHRKRRRREARRDHRRDDALPVRAPRRCGDARAGSPRGARDGRVATGDLRRGRRRCRARPRRRELRRPVAVQRRAPRARGRGVPRAGRQRRRPRAGHAALRPRRRRARLHPDRGGQARRAGPRGAHGATRGFAHLAPAFRPADPRTPARAHAQRGRPAATRAGARRRTRAADDRDAARAPAARPAPARRAQACRPRERDLAAARALPELDACPRLRDRPGRGRDRPLVLRGRGRPPRRRPARRGRLRRPGRGRLE